MIIKKISEGYIDVPLIPKDKVIKRGLYILVYKGRIIKVGIYGEGNSSTNKSRFASYRNSGKILYLGAEVGDTVEVRFKELPEDRMIDGYRWKVDLYYEEKKLKDTYKNSLWLS